MIKRRSFLFALALCLMLTLLAPLTMTDAHAANSGNCGAEGSNVTWTLDANGKLTISGTGAMMDYDSSSPGWNPQEVKSISVREGVTHVGNWAFANCSNVTYDVYLDRRTVTSIGSRAFSNCTSLSSIEIPNQVTAIEPYTFYNCPNLTVHAPAGSYAEQYAKENNIPFVAE